MPPTLVRQPLSPGLPQLSEELPEIIARAHAAGVARMVTICTRLRAEPDVRAIADAHDSVYYAAGTHR